MLLESTCRSVVEEDSEDLGSMEGMMTVCLGVLENKKCVKQGRWSAFGGITAVQMTIEQVMS